MTDDHTDSTAPQRHGALFWTAVALGWGMVLFGIVGLLKDSDATVPAGFGAWFIGLAIAHDAFLAPLVFIVAWAVGRVLPPMTVVPVRLGLATSALLTLYAWPLAGGYGKAASNPSALPLDYSRNLVVSLVVIWTGVVAWIATIAVRARQQRIDDGGQLPK